MADEPAGVESLKPDTSGTPPKAGTPEKPGTAYGIPLKPGALKLGGLKLGGENGKPGGDGLVGKFPMPGLGGMAGGEPGEALGASFTGRLFFGALVGCAGIPVGAADDGSEIGVSAAGAAFAFGASL